MYTHTTHMNTLTTTPILSTDPPHTYSLSRVDAEHVQPNKLPLTTTLLHQRRKEEDTLPKAACPERWVPPPLTRGILATALPVPQDSALVWWPALEDTAYGCRLFLDMLQWTKLTKSGRIGDLNTLGMVTFPPRAPSGSYTVTRGRDVCIDTQTCAR